MPVQKTTGMPELLSSGMRKGLKAVRRKKNRHLDRSTKKTIEIFENMFHDLDFHSKNLMAPLKHLAGWLPK